MHMRNVLKINHHSPSCSIKAEKSYNEVINNSVPTWTEECLLLRTVVAESCSTSSSSLVISFVKSVP